MGYVLNIHGFGLVRASNTTPVLVLRFEAENKLLLDKIMEEFRTLLQIFVDNICF